MEKPKEDKNPLCDKTGGDKDKTKENNKSQKPVPEEPTSTRVERGEQDLLEGLKRQKEEYLNGWKRERADFLNYKKEEMERISALLKYANGELLLKILPVLDNIELAEKQIPEDLKNHKWVKGILQLKNQISEFLKQEGIEEIKTKGERFDPNFHEVVGEVGPSEAGGPLGTKEAESGTIVEEVQKGYKLYGKVIRPAKVKITK